MAYVVTQSVVDNGELREAYGNSFETLDEALDYYHDIDLKTEFSVGYMCAEYGTWNSKMLQKELYDGHGTLVEYDFYDYSSYKGGD